MVTFSRYAAVLLALSLSPVASAQFALDGTGSYLAQPLIRVWGDTYGQAIPPSTNPPGPVVPGMQVNYLAVGSQAGKNAFVSTGLIPGTATPLDFGVTTAPLTGPELQAFQAYQSSRGTAIQVPLAAEAIVFAYNPEGLTLPQGGLRLSRATYCAIADGVITTWAHPAITQDNGGQVGTGALTFVRRSDTSGETLHLSTHLQTVCTGRGAFPPPYNAYPYPQDLKWARGAGAKSEAVGQTDTRTDSVDWPDTFLTAKSDQQVVQTVARRLGAIGYAGAAYTNLASGPLPAARLQNQFNLSINPPQFLAGTGTATQAALTGLTLTTPFALFPYVRQVPFATYLNPTQPEAYPIPALVYGLFYEHYSTQIEVNQCQCFVNWALQDPYPDPLFDFGSNPDPNPLALAQTYATLPGWLKQQVIDVMTAIKPSAFQLTLARRTLRAQYMGKCRDL